MSKKFLSGFFVLLGLLSLVFFSDRAAYAITKSATGPIYLDKMYIGSLLDDQVYDPNNSTAAQRNNPLSGSCVEGGKPIWLFWYVKGSDSRATHYYVKGGCSSDPSVSLDNLKVGSVPLSQFALQWTPPSYSSTVKYCKIWVYAKGGSNVNEEYNVTLGGGNSRPFAICSGVSIQPTYQPQQFPEAEARLAVNIKENGARLVGYLKNTGDANSYATGFFNIYEGVNKIFTTIPKIAYVNTEFVVDVYGSPLAASKTYSYDFAVKNSQGESAVSAYRSVFTTAPAPSQEIPPASAQPSTTQKFYYCIKDLKKCSQVYKQFSSKGECDAYLTSALSGYASGECYLDAAQCDTACATGTAASPTYYYCNKSERACKPIYNNFTQSQCNEYLKGFGSLSSGLCYSPAEQGKCSNDCSQTAQPQMLFETTYPVKAFYCQSNGYNSYSATCNITVDQNIASSVLPNDFAVEISQKFSYSNKYSPVKTEIVKEGSNGQFRIVFHGLKPSTSYYAIVKNKINNISYKNDPSPASLTIFTTDGPALKPTTANYFYCIRNNQWSGGSCYQDAISFNSAEDCERYRTSSGGANACFASYDYCNSFCNNFQYIPGTPAEQPTQCPSGTTGIYPNCTPISYVQQQCPAGTTGIYPNCATISQQSCPANTTGIYPNCTPISYVQQQCPAGTTGIYPNCTTAALGGQNLQCANDEISDQTESVPACKKCYCGMYIWRSGAPNPNANNRNYWIKGFIKSQPNARAGLGDEAEAKKIIDSLKGSSANISYDFSQCQDSNCSSGGLLATGDKSCYRGIWIYFVNNKNGAYLKDVLKGYPKGSENNILTLASPRPGETAEIIAHSTLDMMFSFSNLYEMSAQCDESGGQGEFATGDKWYYCGLQTASCGLTSSGYATQAQCEAALQKNRTGDLATTNKCYKNKEKCQNECKRYVYCSTGTATPTCNQASGVYSSITECEESLKKYFVSGQTSGKCFLSTDECAKNCGKYYYCPTSQNETQCVRTSAVYNSEEDCVESLRKYLKDSAGNYLSTNKCYFDRGSCENNCKAQRFWYCNTASGVCDITYSTYKSAELCQNSLATYLPNIAKPFVCFPSDQKAACTASCQKTWNICEKAVGQCRPFGQYNTDIECEKALAKMTDAGKYNLKCYSSTDSCKDECGGKRNFYYCPSLEETCIKVPEQFTNKQDCESYLKGKTVEGLTSGQYLRVGLPICFEYDTSGMSDCKNQCLKSRPTQFFCVKAALPEMSRCLSTDGRVDYADCVKQITEVFGPSVLPQCWPTLEACDVECKKPSFGVPAENISFSPLSSPIIKGMKKYYYCNKLAKGVHVTSNVYLSVADCQTNLKKYLPGQTTGICYDNANQAASACSSWSAQSYYYCFTGSGTREVRKTSSQYANQESCEANLAKYMPGQTSGQCFTNYANAYSSCSPRFYFCFNGKIVAAENVGSESNCSAVMSRMYGKAVKCMNNLLDAQRNCK